MHAYKWAVTFRTKSRKGKVEEPLEKYTKREQIVLPAPPQPIHPYFLCVYVSSSQLVFFRTDFYVKCQGCETLRAQNVRTKSMHREEGGGGGVEDQSNNIAPENLYSFVHESIHNSSLKFRLEEDEEEPLGMIDES